MSTRDKNYWRGYHEGAASVLAGAADVVRACAEEGSLDGGQLEHDLREWSSAEETRAQAFTAEGEAFYERTGAAAFHASEYPDEVPADSRHTRPRR